MILARSAFIITKKKRRHTHTHTIIHATVFFSSNILFGPFFLSFSLTLANTHTHTLCIYRFVCLFRNYRDFGRIDSMLAWSICRKEKEIFWCSHWHWWAINIREKNMIYRYRSIVLVLMVRLHTPDGPKLWIHNGIEIAFDLFNFTRKQFNIIRTGDIKFHLIFINHICQFDGSYVCICATVCLCRFFYQERADSRKHTQIKRTRATQNRDDFSIENR